MYYQVSCGYICKREKKSTRFVPLVLTGVRVINFLNIANLNLIFLHNTHILTVFLSIGLFFILFCQSCLFVCLCVCLMYSTVGMYSMCEYWSYCTMYICLFFSLFQHFLTVRLSVCLSVYVCTSLFLFVCMYICTSVFLHLCLSFYLHFCTPAFLPAFLSTHLTACLSSCLPSCLPFCLPPCLPTYLPACLPA